MTRTRRTISWLALVFLGLLVIVLVALWIAFASTVGSRFVLSQVERFMDEQLVIEHVEGTLAGPLVLRGVRFKNETVAVELQQANLDWLPSVIIFSDALVHVEHLQLQGLRVVLSDAGEEVPELPPQVSAIPDGLSLPVAIRVDEFAVTDAVVLQQDTASTEPAELARVDRLAATDLLWNKAGIKLPDLEMKAPEITLAANGEVNPKGNWPLRFDGRYTINMSELQLPDVSGRTQLSGTLAQLEVKQRLDAPYALEASANIVDALATPQWQASVRLLGAHLQTLRSDLPDVLVEADITAQGNAMQAGLTLHLSAAQSALRITGGLNFNGSRDAGPSVDLIADWQDLIWPLDAGTANLVASKSGHAEITGELDDYQLSVEADLLLPDYPPGYLTVSGAGTDTLFAMQEFELAVLGGFVSGLAQVDWASGLTSSFDLAGTTIDTAGVLPDWPGQLNFVLQGDAALAPDAPLRDARVNVTNLVLDGLLRDKPVSAKITGKYADAQLQLPSLEFTTLDTTLQAEGNVALSETGRTDFNWQFSLADLSLWQQGAQGSVQASGELLGNLREPRLRTKAVINGIALETLSIHNAEISADLGFDQAPLSMHAVLQDVNVAETSLQRVALELTGSHADHALALSVTDTTGEAEFAARGSLSALPALGVVAPLTEWQEVVWQVSLQTLNILQEELSIAFLPVDEVRTSTVTLGGASFDLRPTCFRLSASSPQRSASENLQRVCAQASGTYTDNIIGKISLDDLSLNLLDGLLPEGLSLSGRLNGDVSADLDLITGAAQADLSLASSALVLRKLTGQGEQQTLLEFAPGTLSGKLRDDALRADIDLPHKGNEGLQAKVLIAADPGKGFSARAIEADIAARLSDLDWSADFVPGVSQLDGVFNSNLRIGGTVAAPNLMGELILTNGNATLPDPGLRLREINLVLRGGGNNDLTLEGSALSGRGEMSLSGDLQDIGKGMSGRIDITGKRFLLLNTLEAQIVASPEVAAQLSQGAVAISGEISVDKADIKLNSLPQTAASVSDDQIIVTSQSEAAEVSENLQVTSDIRLLLNDAVTFEGFGLESTFTGALDILDLPDEPTTAKGEVSVIKGRYQAYGQDLTIERGRLLFVGGAIDQPGLDVRAIRQATPDVKVGVIARGSLRAPEFSIFSQPSMSQSNQLAYLILGRPLNEGTTSESSALSRAALALGIQGGNYLTEQYGDKLGVDNIGIETAAGESNEQAALVVGKYLSPKLYVSYGIGILDAINTLKIEYILSSKWRLASESSTEKSGADLTYTLER